MKIFIGSILLINFLGCFFTNIYTFKVVFFDRKNMSFIPLIGGISGAIGILLVFNEPLRSFFWLLILADLSFSAYFIFLVKYFIKKRN